eukprot:3188781-Pleurochrysis_carterae.AAC.1
MQATLRLVASRGQTLGLVASMGEKRTRSTAARRHGRRSSTTSRSFATAFASRRMRRRGATWTRSR